MPVWFAAYAVGLLFVEGVPADSPFGFVDEVEIDQWVEFDHYLVETLVADAAAASEDVVD